MLKTLTAAAISMVMLMPQAEAETFSFSYNISPGNTLSGLLDGILQGDNNTVVVNSIHDFVSVNGVNGPALPFVSSIDVYVNLNVGLSPTLTLDGSFMDLVACTTADCDEGIAFIANSAAAASFGGNVLNSSPAFGRVSVEFDPDEWQLRAVNNVPTAATLPLLALGAAAMAFTRRKRA